MDSINYNGTLLPASEAVFSTRNRVFRYGDGLFESIRVLNGSIPLLKYHLARLHKGMRILQYGIPAHYDHSFFEKEIRRLIGKQLHYRLRLTVFREDGGWYAPQSDAPVFLIEASPYPADHFQLSRRGMTLEVCPVLSLPQNPFSNLKSCNALPYVIAGHWLKQQACDECLLLNDSGRIAECSAGNLFVLTGDRLMTPDPEEGCIEGVMRSWILEKAAEIGLKKSEKKIPVEVLSSADELWVSNAVQGLRWISGFRNQEYRSGKAAEMVTLLNQWCTRADGTS